jgi:hypothetical protein
MTAWCLGLALLVGAAHAEPVEEFKDVRIDKQFDRYLQANPLLMELAGAKVIRMANGNRIVMSVASTTLKDGSADERLRAIRVCRENALAHFVAEREGVQVAHVEVVEKKVVIVLDENKEKATSVTKVLQLTKTKVQGLAKGMQVVGRWKSADGKVFYLALGMVCDPTGEPIVPDADR